MCLLISLNRSDIQAFEEAFKVFSISPPAEHFAVYSINEQRSLSLEVGLCPLQWEQRACQLTKRQMEIILRLPGEPCCCLVGANIC